MRREVAEALRRRLPASLAPRPARRGVLALLAGLLGLVTAVLWVLFVAASTAEAGELASPSVLTTVRVTLPSTPHLPEAGAVSRLVPRQTRSSLPAVPQLPSVPTVLPPVQIPTPAPSLIPPLPSSLTLPTGEAAAVLRRAASGRLTSPIPASDVGTNAALPAEGRVVTKSASPAPASSTDVPQVTGTPTAETGLLPTLLKPPPIGADQCACTDDGRCSDDLAPGPAEPAPVIPLAPLFLVMPPPVAPTAPVLRNHYGSAPAALSLLRGIPDGQLRSAQVMFASPSFDLNQAPPRGPPPAVDLSFKGGRP